MDYLLVVPSAIFLLFNLLFVLAFLFARKPSKKSEKVPVSILISCRNEERDLPGCIDSIKNLNYPEELIEIVLVDDLSTDKTREIMEEVSAVDKRFKWVSSESYIGKLKAKARGIHVGMQTVTNEWVFITDADGRVPSNWIREMLHGVSDKVGVITGPLNVDSLSLLSIAEKLNYCYSLPVLFGYSIIFKTPLALGPNMVIRKSIYEQEGGLENINFNVAEDLALYRLMKRGGKSAKARGFADTTVDITPVPSKKHIVSQQNRWVTGSREHREFFPLILLWVTLATIHAIVLIGLWFINIELALVLWIVKLMVDSLHYLWYRIKLRRNKVVRLIPIMWLVNIFYFPAGFIALVFGRKIEWHGEGYVESFPA